MHHLRVAWHHDFADEPVELFSELDEARWEIRKVERFRDGSWGWADADSHGGPTRLGIEPVPPLASIRAHPEFNAREIDRASFDDAWRTARWVRFANGTSTVLPSSLNR